MNIELPCTPYDWGDINILAHRPQVPSNMSSLVTLMELALSQKEVLHMKLSEIEVNKKNNLLQNQEVCTIHYGDFGFVLDHINPKGSLPFSWQQARIIDDDCFFTGLLDLESRFSHLFIHDISFEERKQTSHIKRLETINPRGKNFESWPSKISKQEKYDHVIEFDGTIYPSKVEAGVRYIGLRSWNENKQLYWTPIKDQDLLNTKHCIREKEEYEYWKTNITDQIFNDLCDLRLELPQIPNYTRNLSEHQMRTQLLDVLWYAECKTLFFPRYPKNQLKKFIQSLILDGKKWVFPKWMELPNMATSSLVHIYSTEGHALIKIISGFPHQQPYRMKKNEFLDSYSTEDI